MRFSLMCKLLLSIMLLCMAGCDQVPGLSSARVAVLDLNAIAKATGEDQVIRQKIETANNSLNTQLADIKQGLELRVKQEKEKLGESPGNEQQMAFKQFLELANREMQQRQNVARNKSKQYEVSLINSMRGGVKDIAESIAEKEGYDMVYLTSPSLLWFDPLIDITDEVIAVLRANPELLRDKSESREKAVAKTPAT